MMRSHDPSWEEKAFAEDHAEAGGGSGDPLGLGGCIWPPRCYSCSFCKRQFKSAQALGGHMNVHRRDRARLKQHSLALRQYLHSTSTLSCSRVSAQESPSMLQQHQIVMSPFKSKREEYSPCLISHEEDFVETDLCVELNSNRITGSFGIGHEKEMSCKRHKSRSGISGFSFLMIKNDHHIPSEVLIPAAAGAMEEIDLELKL